MNRLRTLPPFLTICAVMLISGAICYYRPAANLSGFSMLQNHGAVDNGFFHGTMGRGPGGYEQFSDEMDE